MNDGQHSVGPERLSEDRPAATEITMKVVVYLLARQWRYHVSGAILGLTFALFSLFWTTPTYTVTMEVMPVRSENGNPGLATLLAVIRHFGTARHTQRGKRQHLYAI